MRQYYVHKLMIQLAEMSKESLMKSTTNIYIYIYIHMHIFKICLFVCFFLLHIQSMVWKMYNIVTIYNKIRQNLRERFGV